MRHTTNTVNDDMRYSSSGTPVPAGEYQANLRNPQGIIITTEGIATGKATGKVHGKNTQYRFIPIPCRFLDFIIFFAIQASDRMDTISPEHLIPGTKSPNVYSRYIIGSSMRGTLSARNIAERDPA